MLSLIRSYIMHLSQGLLYFRGSVEYNEENLKIAKKCQQIWGAQRFMIPSDIQSSPIRRICTSGTHIPYFLQLCGTPSNYGTNMSFNVLDITCPNSYFSNLPHFLMQIGKVWEFQTFFSVNFNLTVFKKQNKDFEKYWKSGKFVSQTMWEP